MALRVPSSLLVNCFCNFGETWRALQANIKTNDTNLDFVIEKTFLKKSKQDRINLVTRSQGTSGTLGRNGWSCSSPSFPESGGPKVYPLTQREEQ